MQTTFEQLHKNLLSKQYAPVYLLYGDEPYFPDLIIDLMEAQVLSPADRSFNQYILFGKDLSVGALLGYVKRYPMMAERQLVIIKDAHELPGLDNKEQTKYLEDYLLRPLASTVLVMVFKGNLDERKAWVKAASQQGVLLASKKLYDNKVPDWIQGYCQERGIKISRKAIEMLNEFVGNDLKRQAAELNKILLNLTVSQEITAEVVERFVGLSKEYNVFELQKALINRDVLKANLIVGYFAANPKENPIQPIILMLFNFFSKLLSIQSVSDKSERNLAQLLAINPFFVKDYLLALRNYTLEKNVRIISYFRQADAQSKGLEGGSVEDADLLRSLIFNILH
jgi:DNA polymerase III subunit delta